MPCIVAPDPNKPKRALSAFFLFSQSERPKVKEANPDAAFGEIVSDSFLRFSSAFEVVYGVEKWDFVRWYLPTSCTTVLCELCDCDAV